MSTGGPGVIAFRARRPALAAAVAGTSAAAKADAPRRRRERPGPGRLDLAVADEAIKTNPAKSRAVRPPVQQAPEIQVWSDQVISCLIDAHPDPLRALPELAASCGMREGELFGVALEDFDFDAKILRVRRQIRKLGGTYTFSLPKNDRERVVPLADWTIQVVREHVAKYPPRPYTLPWEKPAGKLHTCNILFRWHTDGQHVKARNYSATVPSSHDRACAVVDDRFASFMITDQ